GGSGSGGSGSGGSGGGSGSGGSGSGGSGSGGSGSGGSGGGSGSGGSGSGSGGSGSGGSGGGSGSGGSGGGSGSGGSGSGGSGSGGSGGSGSGGSGGSGSGSGGSGSGGSGSNSGAPGTVPEGVPAPINPNYPYPNPDASGQVMVGASQTPTPGAIPSSTGVVSVPTNGLPGNAKASNDENAHKNIGAIVGGVCGFLAFIALVALIFIAARKRRHANEASLAEAAAGSDNSMGGAGTIGPDGYIVGGPHEQPKYEETSGMPDLVPVTHGVGGAGPSSPGAPATGNTAGSGGSSGAIDGTAIAAGAAVLAAGAVVKKHKRKDSIHQRQETVDAGHVTTDESSASNSESLAKRKSTAKFFMGGGGGGDYKPPLRRPSPGPATLPITSGGSKTEVRSRELEVTEGNHNTEGYGKGILAGAVVAAGAVAVAHQSQNRSHKETETQEVLSNPESTGAMVHGRYESTTSTNMDLSEPSSEMYQGGTTSSSSTTSVTHIAGNTTSGTKQVISGMAAAAGAATIVTGVASHLQTKGQVILQQAQPTIQKTQITLKLSIIRYERSDAAQATPSAKPGTIMFSQVEMLGSAPDINIPGSAFSHVRDSSKVTGQEDGLPSPVVPGPSGAATSTESEPRERSLRWMKNEFQWKREAGMLQHLRSDQYIAELFTLYSLPTFAEYRFVSVMGPFTRTLESYIKECRGETTSQQGAVGPLTPRGPLSLMELKTMTDSITSALRWCHERHVVHLNLTPASIFLQEFYSEPDGHGGYRASVYSSNRNRPPGASAGSDGEAPRIEQQWKLWNFGNARFVGEAVDLNMDMTAYTAPEILLAARRHRQNGQGNVVTENPNTDTDVQTTVTTEGRVTKTSRITSVKTSSGTTVITSQDAEKLMAATTMDMWSLGEIVYEMHTSQPMFVSAEDALVKLTSAQEKREGEDDGEDDDDLDKAKAHDKIRQQLDDQIKKIEKIEDQGAREVITGLLEMQQGRRLDHEEIRNLYLDAQT
ncbi:hypothetical protein BGZ98_003796, partial [Dissophora globulifera]